MVVLGIAGGLRSSWTIQRWQAVFEGVTRSTFLGMAKTIVTSQMAKTVCGVAAILRVHKEIGRHLLALFPMRQMKIGRFFRL